MPGISADKWGAGFCPSCGSVRGPTHVCPSWLPPKDPYGKDVLELIREMERQRGDATKLPAKRRVGYIGVKIDWLRAAALRCEDSEDFLRLQIEPDGITIIGEAGEGYVAVKVAWEVIEQAETNPLISAIEEAEQELRCPQ